ncbi:hypothetical protein N9045_00365 [bacterium]|nr:hypothetical protein [bacterium]
MKLSMINETLYHPHSSYGPDDGFEFEEIITRDNHSELGWKRLFKPLRTYKATNNIAGQVIPGFTTTDLGEAKMYCGGGDWGGQHLVAFDVDRPSTIKKDMFLDGQEGPIKIEAGAPAVLIRGTEVIILRPETPLPIESKE